MQKEKIKIAIVRLSALGDIIHSASILPLLFEVLNKQYELTLHWYVDSANAEILQDSPYIHKLISLPLKASLKNKNLKAILEIYHTLKLESYDIVFDIQGLLKSAIITRLIKAKTRIGFKNPKESLATLFYNKKIPIPYKEHILLRNATLTLTPFNIEIPPLESLKTPKIFLGYKTKILPFALLNTIKVLFVLETSKLNKTYPLESYLKLAALFNSKNITPYFLTKNKLKIPQNAERFHHIFNLNLSQIKFLLSKMDLIIGGDTGITHLAWALNRPSITLFGATPQERFNLDTKINHSISANLNAAYKKNDFSISKIPPESIFKLACALLESKGK
ncbi:MAG: lipopolysaccharide heptosyltransferase I [Helicobacter sp.]|nr:lipopolysaccharide heptosyltransferase I [Helicobacteraceae bacterium]MDY3113859.1 lipopolysaccharide heptosyltransferase I [Helicobacter sp.]